MHPAGKPDPFEQASVVVAALNRMKVMYGYRYPAVFIEAYKTLCAFRMEALKAGGYSVDQLNVAFDLADQMLKLESQVMGGRS